MKTLLRALLLVVASLANAQVSSQRIARGTDILISWGYSAPAFTDVPLEFRGRLQVGAGQAEPLRLNISRAYFENDAVTLEGTATFGGGCIMRVRIKSALWLPVAMRGERLLYLDWREEPLRCITRSPASWKTGGLLMMDSVRPLDLYTGFAVSWTGPQPDPNGDGPANTRPRFRVDLELTAVTRSYIRVYLPRP